MRKTAKANPTGALHEILNAINNGVASPQKRRRLYRIVLHGFKNNGLPVAPDLVSDLVYREVYAEIGGSLSPDLDTSHSQG